MIQKSRDIANKYKTKIYDLLCIDSVNNNFMMMKNFLEK
jgi:hypothetical protein